MGSSTSGSKSNSKGSSSSNFSAVQNVWAPQGNALTDLYNEASALYDKFDPSQFNSAMDYTQKYNQGLSDAAMPAWQNQLSGGYNTNVAQAAESPLMQSLQASLTGPSNTGRMYQSIVGGPGNTYIDPMVNAMKTGVMDNLNRQLPGLNSGAIAAGQMGSSRHGIAEGLMRSDANRDMMQQEANMRGGAYDTDLNWKMDIARMADQNIGSAQDRAISLLNSRDAAAQGALTQGQQMSMYGAGNYDAQMMKSQLPWEALSNYAGIVGDPTVLTSASGSSKSKGSSSSKGSSHGTSIKG